MYQLVAVCSTGYPLPPLSFVGYGCTRTCLAVLRAYTCAGPSYTRATLLCFRDVVVIFTHESWPYTAYVGFCVYPLLPQSELYAPFTPD
jgi:hypothetical protein